MEYRRLGASGLSVSAICLGTLTFGDRTDEKTAGRIVAHARDAGVNFIDTADSYAQGRSERIVGKLIKRDRDDWVLATKVGMPVSGPPNRCGHGRKWIMQAIDESLRPAGDRLRRSLLSALVRPRDAARGHRGRARRPGPRGQDPLLGLQQLSRLAGGRDGSPRRSDRGAAADRGPAQLQRHQPSDRNRISAGLRPLWRRGRALRAARARRAEREVRTGQTAAKKRARRQQGVRAVLSGPGHGEDRSRSAHPRPGAADQGPRRTPGACPPASSRSPGCSTAPSSRRRSPDRGRSANGRNT